MSDRRLLIEIFSAPCCNQCDKVFQLADQLLKELPPGSSENTFIELRKLNVVDELDYAVELGVLAVPSIAINGVLIFTAMPRAGALREAILSQIAANNQEHS